MIAVHPEGNMNVCIKLSNNPSCCCRDIKLKYVKLKVALHQTSGSLGKLHPLETMIMMIMFQSDPKCWTN